MIANFTIDQPVLLEINHKMGGGGDYHHVEKSASLCSASVCFFWVFDASKNLVSRPQKKYWREELNWTP
jgi:hypothetical protein